MLTPQQRTEFEQRGLLRLTRATPVEAMRDRIWEYLLAERGIHRNRPETWPPGPVRRLQPLRRSGTFAPMASEPVRAALDDLLGAGHWRPPREWGLPLVTFPQPGTPWRVPATGWHVDSHGPDYDGVTVFTFLDTVTGCGGGTVVLEASHRLVNDHVAATGTCRPADIRTALAAAHPWLGEVWSGHGSTGDEAVLDGVRTVVRELTGGPGDVVLMHPRTLHTAAPNTGDAARLMLVEIVDRVT
jgi:hypothetical protein